MVESRQTVVASGTIPGVGETTGAVARDVTKALADLFFSAENQQRFHGTADELGLTPLVRLVSWGLAGVAPNVMGIGPVPATEAALAKAGLRLSDIDLIELNEAFAAQALAVMKEWKFTAADRERTNVHGSGISLGHPVGATGGRMLATLARELARREARYRLETMCIGGGQGLAAVFERVGA